MAARMRQPLRCLIFPALLGSEGRPADGGAALRQGRQSWLAAAPAELLAPHQGAPPGVAVAAMLLLLIA